MVITTRSAAKGKTAHSASSALVAKQQQQKKKKSTRRLTLAELREEKLRKHLRLEEILNVDSSLFISFALSLAWVVFDVNKLIAIIVIIHCRINFVDRWSHIKPKHCLTYPVALPEGTPFGVPTMTNIDSNLIAGATSFKVG